MPTNTKNEKRTPKRLSEGDRILVVFEDDVLKIATSKRGSLIAELLSDPEKVPAADPVGRSGYALHTSEGLIPFVSAMAGLLIPNDGDAARVQREQADRQVAEQESSGLLAGLKFEAAPTPRSDVTVSSSPAAPAAAGLRPVNGRKRKEPEPAAGQRVPYATGAGAASNYRVHLSMARTEGARAFWQRLIDKALG